MTAHLRLPESANPRLVGALRGKNIFRQGDPAEALYRVEHGCVRLQLEHADGNRQVIAFVFPGQTFCVGLETHWASADAVTDTVLTRYSRSSLRELLAQVPGTAETLLFSADELLTEMAHHVSRLTHSSAYDRMLWFVDWLATQPSNSTGMVDLAMSRQDIADFLGIAPETVSRLLRRLIAGRVLQRVAARKYRYEADALDATPSLLGVRPRTQAAA